MTRLATLLMSGLLLAACGHTSESGLAEAAPDDAVPGIGTGADYKPRMVALPFRLDVTISADVSRALEAADRPLQVTASYYGNARQTGDTVDLGTEERDISPRAQSITLAGRYDAAQVAREVSGDARVRVNAATGGAGGPLLHCTEFEESLSIAVETGGFLHCELIRE